MRERLQRWVTPTSRWQTGGIPLEQSPGAGLLLGQAEHAAQLALHVLRGLLWLTSILGMALVSSDAPPNSRLLVVSLWAALLGPSWLWIWRVLASPRPPGWLRYGLVYLDGGYLLEYLVAIWLPVPGLAVLIPGGAAHDVLTTVAGPLLVFLAISGVFRIDTRAAALAATAAIVTYAIVVIALQIPPAQSLPTGLVIAFTGVAGMVGARVIRGSVLRAGEARILEHYVPRSLLGDLMRTGSGGNGVEEDVTLLLADIRGFTGAVEDMAPAEAVSFLNEYLNIAIPPLLAHGAVVDKYLGDGVLAFFEGERHAPRALSAAMALLQVVATFDSEYLWNGPLRVGVALHTGRAMLGTIGPAARREYTIISDAVNVTSRLEELNKHFGSAMIISDSVLAAGGELPSGCAGPETVELRGHHGSMSVCYLPMNFRVASHNGARI